MGRRRPLRGQAVRSAPGPSKLARRSLHEAAAMIRHSRHQKHHITEAKTTMISGKREIKGPAATAARSNHGPAAAAILEELRLKTQGFVFPFMFY